MTIRLPILFALPLAYFLFRIGQYGLSIDTDEWGILNASRQILSGNYLAGDPNKTLELVLGLIPAYFNRPMLLPILTSIIGAATCLAVYLLVHELTEDRQAALLAWGMLLLSPVLYWQVIVANSVAVMSGLVVVAVYCLSLGRIRQGAVWMALAELSRPEPFFVFPFLVFYFTWLLRNGEIDCRDLLFAVTVLCLPLLWWLGFTFLRSGSSLTGLTLAMNYGKAVTSEHGFLAFPQVILRIIQDHYMTPAALGVALLGVLCLLPSVGRYVYVYGVLLFTVLGYWALVALGTAMQERFLLPIHIFLLVFSAGAYALACERLSAFKGSFFRGAVPPLLAAGLLVLNLNFNGYLRVDRILTFHNGFSNDLPRVATLLKENQGKEDARLVLISARRVARLTYLLGDASARFTFVTFRGLYSSGEDLSRRPIAWVVYAPEDLYPVKSAFNAMEMMTPEGLKRQGVSIEQTWPVSEHTRLIRLVR